MSAHVEAVKHSGKTAGSPWRPFRHTSYTVIWTATVVSNVGYWMYSAASGWLMTSLDPSPLLVALVQVAASLPMCVLALPAGALADIVERRKSLIIGELAVAVFSIVLAMLVWIHFITPFSLLLLAVLIGSATAMNTPAWQAVVPQLVPKAELAPAVSANSAGVNLSRAVGPALGGAIISLYGIAAPFWVNAISNFGVIGALLWWREPKAHTPQLPPEHFGNAVRTGLRYARNNASLGATLVRAAPFALFASAYWALLPLVARQQIAGGAELYGMLLGAIGASAVAGALVLPRLHLMFGSNDLVALGTLGTAVAMALFALARTAVPAVIASVIAGACWIAVLSSLNVSAQVALPDWVRGRGLAMFVMVFYGGLTVGSAIWGQVASVIGLPFALCIAAAGALLSIPLTWRWKLGTGAALDLTPAMDGSTPLLTGDIEPDRGPVLVTTRYDIDPKHREAFLSTLGKLARERRRDGAYQWRTFENPNCDGQFFEAYLTDSWLEFLRQHVRITKADRPLLKAACRFQIHGAPKVTCLIAADTTKPNARRRSDSGAQHAGHP